MSLELIKELTNFDELEEKIKGSDQKFIDAVRSYYKELGERMGFTVRENASIIKNRVNYGKLDLIWLEPNIVFVIEFGKLEDVYGSLWKVLEYSPNLAVLVLSSRAVGCKAEDVSKIVKNSSVIGLQKDTFLIVDITKKEIVLQPDEF